MPESDLLLRKEDTKQRVANSFDVILNRGFYNPASLPFWPTDCLHQGVPAHGSCSSMRWNGNGHAALSSPQPAHKHLARNTAVNAHRPPSKSDTLKELSALGTPWQFWQGNEALRVLPFHMEPQGPHAGWFPGQGQPQCKLSLPTLLCRSSLWFYDSCCRYRSLFCLENTPNTMPASSNTNVHHGCDVAHHLADSNVY